MWLVPDPLNGFKNIGGDLSVGDVAAAGTVSQMAPAQIVHEYNEVSGGLQFAGTFLIVVDAIAGDEAGTSRNQEYGRARPSPCGRKYAQRFCCMRHIGGQGQRGKGEMIVKLSHTSRYHVLPFAF